MNYIAWDTETTGLPTTKYGERATPENIDKFNKCRIVTLAFVKYDYTGKELGSYHAISYPDTYEVTATHVHGVTHEHALEKGQPFEYLYESFKEAVRDTKLLVAHNSFFDENVFFSECYRRGLSIEPFKDVTFTCTLDLARRVFPTLHNHKLITVFNNVFGRDFDGAHDALNDARACGEVYPRLRDNKRAFKSIGVNRIVLKASDIASIVGKNQYKKPKEIIDNLWNKYFPDTFIGKTKEQLAVETIEKCDFAMSLLKDTENYKSFNSTDVERKLKAVSNQLDLYSNLRGEDKKIATEHLRKTLFTNHGTRHEETTANNYDDLLIDENFYTYKVCTIEGTDYEIVGRIDRMRENEDGTKTIVEIKNRSRRLFREVRDYEEVQCQAYMEMLNVDTCELIEQYNDSRMGYMINRDKNKWRSDTLPKIKNFCEYFHDNVTKTTTSVVV